MYSNTLQIHVAIFKIDHLPKQGQEPISRTVETTLTYMQHCAAQLVELVVSTQIWYSPLSLCVTPGKLILVR